MADTPKSDEKDLDDSLKSLQELVRLTEVEKNISDATYAVLTGSKATSTAAPGGTGAGGSLIESSTADPGGGDSTEAALSTIFLDMFRISNELQKITHQILTDGFNKGVGGGAGGGSGGSSDLDTYIKEQRQQRTHTAMGRMAYSVKTTAQWAGNLIKRDIGKGAQIGKAAGRMAGMGARGAAAAGAVGGAVGGVAAGATVVAVALYEAHKAIVNWTNAAFESMSKLAEASGSMAAVMAERDVRQFVRDQERGEAVAGSAYALMESEDRRKNATAPIENAIDNLRNNALTALNDAATPIIEGIGSGLEYLKDIFPFLDKIAGKGDDKPAPWGVVGEMADTIRAMGMDDLETRKMMDEINRAAANVRGGNAAPAGAAMGGLGDMRPPPL